MQSTRRLAPPTLVALMVAAACGASNEGSDNTSTGSTTSSGGNSAGGATADGGGGATTDGSGGMGGGFDPVGSGGMGGMETCLASSAEAQKKPLDIVVVWDRSGSMSGAKWTGTVSAVTQFVNDPANDGVSLGINFFPLDGAPDQCNPAIHNPPQLGLTALPAGAGTVVSTINATSPGGLTPTYGALFGTLQYLTAYQDMNPTHAVVAILASDGSPTECNTSTPAIAGLAQSAFTYNGVRTYAIAIQGSSVADLDQIAAAGGTTQAIDVTTDINLFKQAMEEIRADALGCEFPIPEQPQGEEFDPQKLNITYTPGGMGTATTIPKVAGESACGNGAGWYYDDPVNPTTVILCSATCTLIGSDTEAKIDLEFGCPTVID
jgi:Mg-chelatase subunit ChlD